MKVSCIIVGQGIGGTCLAWQLRKRGISFLVIDQGSSTSASAVSSGLINPITGRNYVKSWMVENLISSAVELYGDIEKTMNKQYVHCQAIVRCLLDIQEENSWHTNRLRSGNEAYMTDVYEGPNYEDYLRAEGLSFQKVLGGMSISVADLLADVRTLLLSEGSLREATFDSDELRIDENGVTWRDISGDVVLFATGAPGIKNPYFPTESYRPVRGEVIIAAIDDFPEEAIIKFKKFIVPLGKNQFWVGSNYIHDSEGVHEFSEELTTYLDRHLKSSYKVIDKKTGVRATTKFRRPFVCQSPVHTRLYLLNGLGTKGVSLAPYWTRHLIEHIYEGSALSAELRLR